MRLARQRLRNWAQTNRITISAEQETIILDRFSVKPDSYEWSEQDIYEQTRNFLKYGTFEKPLTYHLNPTPTVGAVLSGGLWQQVWVLAKNQ